MKRVAKRFARQWMALSDRGLEDQVAIKGVGCLNKCSSGPNLVVMPDKTRYSRIQPEQIPALIEKHFPATERE
jgi:(2Fe-2S) ferredoxin